MSRQLLARAWARVPVPVTDRFTIDLDSTICETYGLPKEGALHHGYTGVRGYHPLLAVAAGTGDVLHGAPARGPRQHGPRAPATSCARRSAGSAMRGATGQLTMRADSGFYAHAVVAICRRLDVRFSITVRQHRSRAGA